MDSYHSDFLDKKETVRVNEIKDNKQSKEKQAPLRTERPTQEVAENE